MTPELEDKLFKKYPKIFRNKNKPITESLVAFGFEFGDGWFQLSCPKGQGLSREPKPTEVVQ